MRLGRGLAALPLAGALAPAAFAAYTYFFADTLTTINFMNWIQVGSVAASPDGLTATSFSGGSLIYRPLVPGTDPQQYEAKMRLRLTASGGAYVLYLRASDDALSGPLSQGTYFAVEVDNPTFGTSGCTATLRAVKRTGGSETQLASGPFGCAETVVVQGVARQDGFVVHLNDQFIWWFADTSLPSGKPGVGARGTPSGNTVAKIEFGQRDYAPPAPVDSQSVGITAFPHSVDIQWAEPSDGASGTGVHRYDVYRNGEPIVSHPVFRAGLLTDSAVQPDTPYTYTIYPIDYHLNYGSPTSFNVRTAPLNTTDPRRIGVKPAGAYWGGLGEQIDLLSGNLNFTVPLVKAQGRAGWSVPFNLSYNSQLWRKDPAGTWKLGRDVGYGFGWRLGAGSITPVWTDYWAIHHYLFTDATGAEYRLDVNTNNVWTSKEGIYLAFDATANRLYFPDGTFWVMGAESNGAEQDAGTRYPTLIQDSNGNQVKVRYKPGIHSAFTDTSARIDQIEDVRAVGGPVYVTYQFNYNSDPIPHLYSIVNYIQTAENYSFSITPGHSLLSPFAPYPSYGTTSLLVSLTNAIQQTQSFEYGTSGRELTKVVYPYGGYLRWEYAEFAYFGDRRLREVQNRYLYKGSGSEALFNFYYDPGEWYNTVHAWRCVYDNVGVGFKCWWFASPGTATWMTGLPTAMEEKATAGSPVLRRLDFTWAQNSTLNPYIQTVVTTLDGAYQTKKEQTLDAYGNVTQTKLFNFGSLSTPARTYDYTYLNDTPYLNRHIRNRVRTASVTAGGQTTTLAHNFYDQYGVYNCSGYFSVLATVSGQRQHDSAAYHSSFYTRGNVTAADVPGRRQCFSHWTTGLLYTSGDAHGRLTSVTHQSSTNYAAPSSITVNSETSTFYYTAFLGLTQSAGPNGDATTVTYDGTARPQRVDSPHGSYTLHAYSTAAPHHTATTYWRKAPGDPEQARWVKTSYDGFGRTVKVETGHGSTTVSAVQTEYDGCACSPIGKVKRVSQPYTGAPAAWTTYTYDGLGRVAAVALPGDSGTTAYEYLGNTVKVTDPAGKWKKFTADVFGNLVQVTEPAPSTSTAIRVNAGGGQYTDPGGNVWAADYGHNGGSAYMVSRPIANTNTPQLYQSERWNSSTVQYQFAVPNGSYQVTLKFAEIWFSSGGQRVFHLVINGTTVQTNFDPFTAAGGRDRAVDRTYAVNVTGGQVTIQLTPVVSNPKISALEIVQTAGGGTPLETLYTYDIYDRLRTVEMTRGSVTQTRTFTYDGTTQRLMSVANPENGTTSFTYNPDGTVEKRTDAKGQEVRYTYDTKKRVAHARRYVGGVEQACQAVTYTYDSGSYSLGRLSSLQWGGAGCAGGYGYTEAYTYAQPGNVLAKTLTVVNAQSQAAALAAVFTYDNEGRRTQVKYPNWSNYGTPVTGPTYTYGFDAVARPASLTGDGQTWVQNVVYSAAGQITSMQYLQTGGTWLTETRAYNARLQMTSQTVAPAGGGAAWLDLRYNYPAAANNGQLSSLQDLVSGETVSYQYDTLQRLISATAGTAWGNAYSYDGFGNLLAKTVTAGSAPTLSVNVDGTTNRITTAGYSYDLNGNMTAVPGVTGMAYDVDNRLVTANGEAYSYSPVNQRVWLRKSGGTERFTFYDLNGQRLAEYTPWVNGGTLYFVQVKAELYFGGKRIRSGGFAVAEDRLGSTRREDTTASRFFPWGEENGSTANDRQKFATYHRDAGTGLDYANQRYYSATVGRFLTADPYQASGGPADPGSWNRYGYVQGDPVNWRDPEGLFARCPEGTHTGPDARSCVPDNGKGSWYDPLADAYVQLLRMMGRGGPEPFRLEVIPEDAFGPFTCFGESASPAALATVQTVLDLAGLIPGPGEVADLANALLYSLQGDGCNAVLSLAAVFPIGGQAFTAARVFRNGVLARLGVDAAQAAGRHAHHVLPQQFAERFARLGLDVNDPRFGALMQGPAHMQLHNVLRYNAQWDEWLGRNPNATADDALNFARKLAGDYGFSFNP